MERPDFKATFMGMHFGNILGIIDHQGAVDSVFIPLDEMEDWMHGDVYGLKGVFHRWRWFYSDGITTSGDSFRYCGKMDVEDYDRIQRHLTKKYWLKFGDRGRLDWKHFMSKVKEEEKKEEENA